MYVGGARSLIQYSDNIFSEIETQSSYTTPEEKTSLLFGAKNDVIFCTRLSLTQNKYMDHNFMGIMNIASDNNLLQTEK